MNTVKIIQVCIKPCEFNALTVIDTVSNLVELVRIDEKTSSHVARKYAQVCLSRYPWPELAFMIMVENL